MEIVPFSSSFSQKMEEKLRLQKAFESAQTTEEMVKALEEVEKEDAFTDKQVLVACYRIAFKLHHQDKDHHKALTFTLRALSPFYSSHLPPLSRAYLLKLMGSIHFHMNRFDVCLLHLEEANHILRGFLGPSRVDAAEILAALLDVLLMQAKAHKKLLSSDKGIGFCCEAIKIQGKWQGYNNNNNDPKFNATLRNFLGILYSDLEEHVRALEQFALAKRIYEDLNLKSDLLRCEIDVAVAKIGLKRYDEAVGTLNNMLQQIEEKDWEIRVLALIALAKASCDQGNSVNCRNYLLESLGILDQKENESPVDVAQAYLKMCMHYETIQEVDAAIFLLKRALNLTVNLPYEKHFVGIVHAELGTLHLLKDKFDDAITYAQNAIDFLVYGSSSRNIRLAYNYNTLGIALLKSGKPEPSVGCFTEVKRIMNASLPLNHVFAIEACQRLSIACGAMNSFGHAIDYQLQVIKAWESHGESAADRVREARQLLKELQEKAAARWFFPIAYPGAHS